METSPRLEHLLLFDEIVPPNAEAHPVVRDATNLVSRHVAIGFQQVCAVEFEIARSHQPAAQRLGHIWLLLIAERFGDEIQWSRRHLRIARGRGRFGIAHTDEIDASDVFASGIHNVHSTLDCIQVGIHELC